MKAILLAAGLGTRLRPLTNFTPKCLVPIAGRPLLDIWLERLCMAGVDEFLINTHYLAEKVDDFVASSKYAPRITRIYEKVLLGTAGTLIENLGFFDGQDGLLIHADNYCMADFQAFFTAHACRPSHNLLTMMTFNAIDPSQCGVVEIDAAGQVINFYEKLPNPPGRQANAAIYLLSSHLLKLMNTEFRQVRDFSTEVIPHLLGRMGTWHTEQALIDVGTPQGYAWAQEKERERQIELASKKRSA